VGIKLQTLNFVCALTAMKHSLVVTLEEMESSQESAAIAVIDHLRMTAENGPDYEEIAALRDEAENVIEWALYFLRETGGVPPRLMAHAKQRHHTPAR
jgi:hypothetical protein